MFVRDKVIGLWASGSTKIVWAKACSFMSVCKQLYCQNKFTAKKSGELWLPARGATAARNRLLFPEILNAPTHRFTHQPTNQRQLRPKLFTKRGQEVAPIIIDHPRATLRALIRAATHNAIPPKPCCVASLPFTKSKRFHNFLF